MKDTRAQFRCLWSKTTGSGNKIKVNYCSKIQAEDSDFCPHHVLISSEEAGENERRMEKARRGKERKKILREALESSPLRVVNPDPKFNQSGYSR